MHHEGFVLVGVIWFLACMTLVVAAAMLWIERSREGLEAQRQLLQQRFEERTMLSRVTWLIATHRLTVAGLTTPESRVADIGGMDPSILPAGAEIPMDGREYCLANGVCVTLIDRASRISLSGSEPVVLRSLLVNFGVPLENTPQMLVELAVYLKSASNASNAGVTMRSLRSPMEVFLLPAWRPWEELLVSRGWNDLVAVDETALNLNTANAAALLGGWGLSTDSVTRLLSVRQEHPIMQRTDLEALMGAYAGDLPDEGWSRLPSATALVRIRLPGSVPRYEYQINFESNDIRLPPWQLLQRRTLSRHASELVAPHELHATPGILSAPLVAGPWGR